MTRRNACWRKDCSAWDRRRARDAKRPASRATCRARGCCGAPGRVRDQGAKALSAIASLVDSRDEHEIDQILASIPDPVGTFYRYSLPASLLHNKRNI